MHVVLIGNLTTGYHIAGPFQNYVCALAFAIRHVANDSLYTVFEVSPKETFMPIDRNHLPGFGDASEPDPDPGFPEWAMEQAQEEIMTNDRLFEFVTRFHYDAFFELYKDDVVRIARRIIDAHASDD